MKLKRYITIVMIASSGLLGGCISYVEHSSDFCELYSPLQPDPSFKMLKKKNLEQIWRNTWIYRETCK